MRLLGQAGRSSRNQAAIELAGTAPTVRPFRAAPTWWMIVPEDGGTCQMDKRYVVTDPEQVETAVFEWGRFNVTCSPELNEGTGLSAGMVVMHPGLGHERHNHPGAEEILHVISGSGEQMVEDPQGRAIIYSVQAGSTIHVPADRYHATLNTGAEPLAVFVVYAPPGPETAPRAMTGVQWLPPRRPRDG